MCTASEPVSPLDTSLVEVLMQPAAFEHPVDSIELIQTHISWVILAGDYVYKIKKPVKLAFLDFSDLERRKFYCDEELRLNRLWAPEIYLDVVPIAMENGQAKFAGEGTPVEYAVRMRRFDQSGLLDRELERGMLAVEDMRELGAHVAERHLAAKVVDASRRERVIDLTKQFIWDNFTALEGVVEDAELERVRAWTKQELGNLETKLAERFDNGFVRDCHGDLHLRNLVRLSSGISAFDCIEFDEDLRHIDVFCDIAFLMIDLVARRRHDLAAHFLNRYLERTGDYDGMSVFSLFFVYRCLVRAKVAAIRCAEQTGAAAKAVATEELDGYFDMAKRQIAPRSPILITMSGLSGSGKTWISTKLMGAMPAIRVRSDIERKRMFGLEETESSASAIGEGIYTPATSRKVYDRLNSIARLMLSAEHNVILDAAFLRQEERAAAIDRARKLGIFPVILVVSAPEELMRERILGRARAADDASESGIEVLEHQLESAEPVTNAEQALVIEVENKDEVDVAAIAAKIKDAAKRQQ
jgi:aminoglycoside phosphotransferase family enzyme/adenylate kinase family enzyme